jgi:PAS domain S-box-containing protein
MNDSIPLDYFKKAVDSAFDHIIISDPNGIILYANAGVERITGFTRNEIIGKKAGSKDLWGGIMQTKYYEEMWDTISKKREIYKGQIKNRKKNGQIYYSDVTITPIISEDTNEIMYYLGVERDISKEKSDEKIRTEFLSLASHQLRTPLSAINWYLELLTESFNNNNLDVSKDYINEIEIAKTRMQRIIGDLLSISRLELGTMKMDKVDVNLIEIIEQILVDHKITINTKELNIDFQHEATEIKMSSDPAIINTLFDNLISNAVKYTGNKGHILIRLWQEGDKIYFLVDDDGIGIPEEDKNHIFKKLFRAENVKRMDTDGTGLGLYLTKAIVDRLNGQIEFESEIDKGTTFKITLFLNAIDNEQEFGDF